MSQAPAQTQPPPAGPLEAAQGASWLHRLDPRAKLAVALGLSLVVALGQSWPAALTALAVGLAALASARLPWRQVLGRLAAVNFFVVLLWVFLPWRLGWDNGWQVGLDPEGLRLALLISLKTNAVFAIILALLGTGRVEHVFHALAHFHAPDKLVNLFLFFYRYLHVLKREQARLAWALKVRGFTPGNNLRTWRTYASLVGVLLVRGYDRAERVYQAMLCRGFSGTLWLLDHFHWSRRDTVFCWCAGLVGLGLAILNLGGAVWS
ncbi:MAG: cobalt ECF transporter T component CbiQ [Desulfarculaceae bacterium]|nr:cobalt ECF transporter T component CbiQ [Desulfarculaceae bacterium]MCF8074136.1 cobalt ECF transporter T component CbiQ [Desulfarculaceae bacterium]MCF8103272.1 cobalt ECF transporter T component CbiQ [Desulfarculaceae bacterium]MCF8116870.1 cobalt ECF transporter T component CbiQ [Desulfarculaceae bacterium]